MTKTASPALATSRRSRTARSAPRRGREQARLFTPPRRRLTRAATLGFEIIDFWEWVVFRLQEEAALAAELEEPADEDSDLQALAEQVGAPMPWQRWFLKHAFELLPGGGLRFRRVLLLVGRQNGKTLLMAMIILWRLFQQESGRGVIGLAQKEEKAHETWSLVVAIAQAVPELNGDIRRVGKQTGKTVLKLKNRVEYRPQPANTGGGRGFTADMILFDELREHTDWAPWSAASNATKARPDAQTFGVSNAGGPSAIVLRKLRLTALKALEGEEMTEEEALAAESLAIFEWSAPPGAELTDRDGWAQANPALGYTITEAAIAEGLSDPEWEFRTETLCQFLDEELAGPFPDGLWSRSQIGLAELQGPEAESYLPDLDKPVGYGIDLSFDRSWLSVAMAFHDRAGRKRVEVVARRAGTDWLIGWASAPERAVAPTAFALQAAGAPVSSMADELERAGFESIPWGGADLGRWHGAFYDAIRSGELTHTGPQPPLDIAAATAATKAVGDSWVIDRKHSREDVAPLVACIAAYGALMTHDERPSVYEEESLFIV